MKSRAQMVADGDLVEHPAWFWPTWLRRVRWVAVIALACLVAALVLAFTLDRLVLVTVLLVAAVVLAMLSREERR